MTEVPPGRNDWDGDAYQARIAAMANEGKDLHGEAGFVEEVWNQPAGSLLDAGCGTGRVGIEMRRRGWNVVGVDVDASMLATAKSLDPEIEWHEHDLASDNFDLGQTFDVVLLAGNVPLFTPAGTIPALIAGSARHLNSTGIMICGFSLGRGVTVAEFDQAAHDAGLELVTRYATWDADAFTDAADYQLSIHRHAAN